MSAPAAGHLTRRCDMPECGMPRAKRYEVIFEDGRVVADLCRAHAQVLQDMRRNLIRGAIRLEPPRPAAARGHSTAPTPASAMPDDL